MKDIYILWIDDEIELLKPHILFLQEKGYKVQTANNGKDALEIIDNTRFDIVFLDEQMPGLSGLETLEQIKKKYPDLPVVMVTKSEEEYLMDGAIGAKINDYLIKPVNPKQILLSIKKLLEYQRLVTEKAISEYQIAFREINRRINEILSFDQWVDIYKTLVYWELELESAEDPTLNEILQTQKADANQSFVRYIKDNYKLWFASYDNDNTPIMSHNVFKKKIIPELKNNKVILILIDNMRYDQWRCFQKIIKQYFLLKEQSMYCSILPTATTYARNTFFAGLMPADIAQHYPQLWAETSNNEGKNVHEPQLLNLLLKRNGINCKYFYYKINDNKTGEKITQGLNNLLNNHLIVLVYNFVDILSHARTEIKMLRQLAANEAAYRSLALSWFEYSPLLSLIKKLSVSKHKFTLIFTTDHGSIRVNNPVKVVGDRETTTNLRFKEGKNLNYKADEVFEISHALSIRLPKPHLSSRYIFATGNNFFVYPNNYNYYVKYFTNTFQHGGISMEEMIIPCDSFVKQ